MVRSQHRLSTVCKNKRPDPDRGSHAAVLGWCSRRSGGAGVGRQLPSAFRFVSRSQRTTMLIGETLLAHHPISKPSGTSCIQTLAVCNSYSPCAATALADCARWPWWFPTLMGKKKPAHSDAAAKRSPNQPAAVSEVPGQTGTHASNFQPPSATRFRFQRHHVQRRLH